MMETFLIQLVAAAFGAVSTAGADWAYNAARIGRRVHSLWVAASIALISLPVTAWAATVFLGPGFLGRMVAAIIVGAIFLGVHRNLPQSRPVRKPSREISQHSSAGPIPPASSLNG